MAMATVHLRWWPLTIAEPCHRWLLTLNIDWLRISHAGNPENSQFCVNRKILAIYYRVTTWRWPFTVYTNASPRDQQWTKTRARINTHCLMQRLAERKLLWSVIDKSTIWGSFVVPSPHQSRLGISTQYSGFCRKTLRRNSYHRIGTGWFLHRIAASNCNNILRVYRVDYY